MTRINVVEPSTLHTRHLCAEYRELPRVFALAHAAYMRQDGWSKKQPKNYTMGSGHVTYFYDKLKYLADRHKNLVDEMLKRGYAPQHTECLEAQWKAKFPSGYWKQYVPTEEAVKINMERINQRLGEMK
jgi:deoxyribonuclease (pyrimidine dimer)